MIPFPFIDRQAKKLRPALVLSNNPDGDENQYLVLAMITSAKRSHWSSDILLKGWQTAGLNAPSIVRWKIFTLEAALVENKRGVLCEEDLLAVRAGLNHIIKI